MRIINQNNYYRQYNPAFNSYRHIITNKAGDVLNRGDTCFFRWDLDFNNIIKFIENKYSYCDKVNIIAHACSDGEEVFSFTSKLLDTFGEEKAKKYLPIQAKDIEDEHLNLAKKGKYIIKSFEKDAFNFYLGRNFYNYFEYLSSDTIKRLQNLKDNVIFSKQNILEDVKTIDFQNTVLFARNFWHYLDEEDMDKLAMNLSHRMNKSSTLVIGNFDVEYGVNDILYHYGFDEKLENVYEKYK